MVGIRWVANGFSGSTDLAAVPCTPADPGLGELRVRIRAAGVNPADLKHVLRAYDPALLPMPIGYEAVGDVTAVGPGTRAASGAVAVGDRIAAFRVHGAYAEEMTLPAEKAFVLPAAVPDDQAAGLLLAGTTAAEMLHRSGARRGDTVLLHGASGAVGAIVVQLAARAGVTVIGTAGIGTAGIGTAGPDRAAAVARFGGVPVAYGPGLADRVRDALIRIGVDGPPVAALDAAGTDEATAVSLDLVADRSRIITVADRRAAADHGFVALSGADAESAAFRDRMRGPLLELLADGSLTVPIAARIPLADAPAALDVVASGRAHGKIVLIP
ncbi:quinone oxidoreductase family protein [Gordonia shandongensis]|uniref:quinone oxidoreductase family protein n=1 Tax=Gordonia shandongensis TaxID=376351 RepID=UPI00047CD8EC|nr:zinc-binding dehydrogenase [Gordonia shandongensis]